MTRAAGTEALIEQAERLEVEAAARSWKPYSEYRESGAEWLGRVPSHWQGKRLKYAVHLINEKVEDVNGLPYIGLEHIESWTGRRIESESPVSTDGVACRFDKGDVLFGKLRPYLAKAYLAEEPGVCTAEALVLRPQLVRADYLKYYVLTRQLIEVVDGSTYGSKMPRANWQFIGGLECLIPPPTEQRPIAAFLDRKTRQIDELIEKKHRLIELLQEKRTALISHAVTKGLNPDAPMRPTDTDGLGDIPTRWDVKRLRRISPRLGVGLVINPSTYVDDAGTVPFFFGSNVREFTIDSADARRITEASNLMLAPSRLNAGDVVVVRVGAPGVAAVVPPELDGSNCASMMIVRRHDSFDSAWLCYVLNSAWGKFQVDRVSYGAAQKQFNIGHAVNFAYPVPPIDEQRKIAAHLNTMTKGIADLIDEVESAIDCLGEYRQAVISAAVTGKIDVREEAAA